MESVNSFDIFDTLLARTVKIPTDIFDIIENTMPYENFKKIRLQAQQLSDNTINSIYNEFKKLTNENDETIVKIKEFELHIEINNTIPILSNILKMKNEDIIVSDMYLNIDDIVKILSYHNINININNLYITPAGKSSGYIWEKLKKKYNIINHTGDNLHSDINMANKFNIKTTYTQIHNFTKLENNVYIHNKDLCSMIRKFRLLNPYDEFSINYKLYDQQIQYNIPFLIFICKQLASILINENRDTVLFLSRDGCLLIKIFSTLYPQFKTIYFHNSRIINNNYNIDYIKYLKQSYNRDSCILFDLHGSFNSGRQMFMEVFGYLPRIYIFSLANKKNIYENMTYSFENISNIIEDLNSDLVGTLVNFNNDNDIRAPVEYNKEIIKIYHKTIEMFIDYIINNNFIPVILNTKIFNDLQFVNQYIKDLNNIDIIFKYNKTNIKETLTQLANKYNSDKGNTYKCAHHYTLKYEEIIDNIVNKNNCINKIKLLEIGLNRDNTDSIPSLMIWKDYFNDICDLTGFDINKGFFKFNNKYNNIKIKIGDQTNINDLQQLKNKKYHIIIDDGYHASKHQQISFKTLWDNVETGGYYIIEDLHYQPEKEPLHCIKTRVLFENWQNKNYIETEFINSNEISDIINSIEYINFFDSQSKLHLNTKNAFVYIKKK
jgi:hypothetical protein